MASVAPFGLRIQLVRFPSAFSIHDIPQVHLAIAHFDFIPIFLVFSLCCIVPYEKIRNSVKRNISLSLVFLIIADFVNAEGEQTVNWKIHEKLIPARERWAKVVDQRRAELHEQIKAVLA